MTISPTLPAWTLLSPVFVNRDTIVLYILFPCDYLIYLNLLFFKTSCSTFKFSSNSKNILFIFLFVIRVFRETVMSIRFRISSLIKTQEDTYDSVRYAVRR